MKKLLILLISLLFAVGVEAQERKVPFNGLLLTLQGKPVKNARIFTRSPKDYAQSNKAGEFGLTNVGPNDTIRIQIKKNVWSVPVNGRRSLIIRIGDDISAFESQEDEQLVSLGFTYVPRRERTVAANFISGEELRRSGQSNILAAMQGRVPGLNITVGPYGQAVVNIRGERTIMGDSTPLFFIDEVKVPSLDGISLNDVDYVEVMKEASAYGSEGGNGAIIVHTKLQAK